MSYIDQDSVLHLKTPNGSSPIYGGRCCVPSQIFVGNGGKVNEEEEEEPVT